MDPNLYNMNEPQPTGVAIWQSIESVLELQEALLGKLEAEQKVDETKVAGKKKKSGGKKSISSKSGDDKKKEKNKLSGTSSIKSSKSNKSKGSGKGSSAGKSGKKVAANKNLDTSQVKAAPSGPITLGIGSIDLLNVFLGNNEPEQNVLLKQYPPFFDDRMMIISKAPVIRVKISVDDDCICRSVCSVTVESIFNIPDVCSPDLTYKINIPFPSAAAVRKKKLSKILT